MSSAQGKMIGTNWSTSFVAYSTNKSGMFLKSIAAFDLVFFQTESVSWVPQLSSELT